MVQKIYMEYPHLWKGVFVMEVTGRAESVSAHDAFGMPESELLRPEMAFLAENPEAFGLVPDACPLTTKHLLIAANGHGTEGGVNSPAYELESKGVEGLFTLYGDLLPHTEEVAEALQSAFGENNSLKEHPVSRYCATLAEVTALHILRGAAFDASFEQTRVMLNDRIQHNLSVLREVFCSEEGEPLWAKEFFTVSLGICRIRETGDGNYLADVFTAGDFRLYLIDDKGMAPLWDLATPVFSPYEGEMLTGKRISFCHPEPFALLLVSESICALNAAEHRSLRSNPGLIWRYRMRLEDYFLRLIADCVREHEFGERAMRFFLGRSHGRDSASGAMTVLRDGISYEVFRLQCQNRLIALENLMELLPDGYDPHNVPKQESRTNIELTYIHRLLEHDADLNDRIADALRLCVLDKLEQGISAEATAPPADVPDYTRLKWEEISRTYRRFDSENDEDRLRIENNARMLRETLSEHWITLRPVLADTKHSLPRNVQAYRDACERQYGSCLEMNSRLAELLGDRRKAVTELGHMLSDSLDILDAEGNDWICGRAGADRTDVWVDALIHRLPALLAYLRTDWKKDTEQYRSLLTAYTAEREALFRRDTHPEYGCFASDWHAIREGRMSEGRWELLHERLLDTPETASFSDLFESLHRISRGTGALRNRIRSRAAESRMARELAARADLRVAALRGAAYEDLDWGDGVIAVMDTATRNDFRATVRRWQERCELAERQKQAYEEYRTMYGAYVQ